MASKIRPLLNNTTALIFSRRGHVWSCLTHKFSSESSSDKLYSMSKQKSSQHSLIWGCGTKPGGGPVRCHFRFLSDVWILENIMFQFCMFIIIFCNTCTQILIEVSCFISAGSLFVLSRIFFKVFCLLKQNTQQESK